ncbi:hypothetical protein C8Q80DRAFT_1105111 [Daedaleopsis nitida]|nr:hypothetical protein C8Q80DRAFT_1105111 [Daedaleopsis nitida]
MRSFKRRPDTRTIPPHIASYIERTVAAALKDPVGRRDFALAADGARIASKLTSPSDSFDTSPSQLPENILDEDLRSASCWSFPDTHGQVAIKLPDFIYPTHITIDHVPHDVAADVRRAPRDLIVWGVMEGTGNQKRYTNALASFLSSPLNSSLGDGPPITGGGTFLPLAAFEYSIHSDTHIQTFPIDPAVVMSRIYFGIFVIEIKSNWGAPSTRLYRVRIHGAEVSA